MVRGKRILLIISGGIAAYKALELIRRLKERGAAVRCILTASGAEFVTPLSVGALSEDKVYSELFDLTDEHEMGHIELSRDADLLVVAPATANILAKMANGIADDLATTALLATDKPVMAAPAMNVRMWEHAATRDNLKKLAERGVMMIGPNEGDMACGEYGPGRMSEPMEIVDAIEKYFAAGAPLSGRKALVTSGPTVEAIDPVRFITNRSSGKQGHAIARALSRLGADTTLISGPVAVPDPAGVNVIHVESASEMLAACERALPVDVAVCAAAVSDWRVKKGPEKAKIKKSGNGQERSLNLEENPDILKTLAAAGNKRPKLVIGFAAETGNLIKNAKAKLKSKGCDWILANDVSADSGTFGGNENLVHLVSGDTVEDWPRQTKDQVADHLSRRIADYLENEA